MERTGLIDDAVAVFIRNSLKTDVFKEARDLSGLQRHYENSLCVLSAQLRESAAIGDPELTLQLERACIRFEIQSYAVTPNDKERLQRYLSQNGAAEKSLEFLRRDPGGYKKHIHDLFPDGLKTLPDGDAYITHVRTQINALGHAQIWMLSLAEKDFLEARKESLRAGLKAFKELQRSILFPPPSQKKQTVDQPRG